MQPTGCLMQTGMMLPMNKVFGKCALPHYHGHNYELEVKVTGKPDKKTGYVMDLKELGDLVKEKYIQDSIIKT